MTSKADKYMLDKLYQYCDDKYALKNNQIDFIDRFKSQMEENSAVIKENKEQIKHNLESLSRKIHIEIKNATSSIKGSYLEDTRDSSHASSQQSNALM